MSKMAFRKSTLLLIFTALFCSIECQINADINNGKSNLSLITRNDQLLLVLTHENNVKLAGQIGVNLAKPTKQCQDVENCFEGNGVRLHVTKEVDDAFTIFWTVTNGTIDGRKLEDCFNLNGSQWYGGPERFDQYWPIQKLVLDDFANVLQENQWGAVVEPYWLNSNGSYIFVDQSVPLFINQNTAKTGDQRVCFSAQNKAPYPTRNKLVLQYTIAAQRNAREGHLHAVRNFLGKPTGHPNPRLIEKPIWSTWARYKRDVSDKVLLEFAQEISNNGYDGQFEIDDDWEECYGALTFTPKKFSNIDDTVRRIKRLSNFTVSLWVHPFVNIDCTKYLNLGRKLGYFVKNASGSDLTQWWNSNASSAVHLDFTQSEVRNWFVERLKRLRKDHGIDSFKFDAGETSWLPQVPVINGDVDQQPNNAVVDYVRTCAKLGDLVEVRSAWKTQDLPIFVRMIDKDSRWGSDNGLYTLITTLLQMNLNGYSMVLPDMIGGNGYGNDTLDGELFIRWLQATVFMPSLQFSFVPWDFNSTQKLDVKGISRKLVELHETFAPYILHQMRKSVKEGHPVNAPIWWVDPENGRAQSEDTEFLLGDDILVAPVITKGATTRDVYLPFGEWYDPNTENYYWRETVSLRNYSAPIDVLPYFVRTGSMAYEIAIKSLEN